jgi:hypothetical protein
MPKQNWALTTDAHEQMADMVFGYCVSQVVRAFAELSVADHLTDGPLTAAELCEREASAPDATFRLMRAGVSLGLLTVDREQRFSTTALLNTLRKDGPRSLRGWALALTSRAVWLPWGQFATSVREGQSQTGATLGASFFDYLQQNPSLAAEFSSGMDSGTSLWTHAIVDVINTADATLAVDVGGANGSLLRLLQEMNPSLRGVVFDRPAVADRLATEIAGSGLAERLTVVGGDFFVAVPAADLYLLKFVLHDWDDESCATILRNCRESMLPGGRVVIIEMVMPEHDAPSTATLMDLGMLAVVGGRERSLSEYDALLAKAGLRRSAFRSSDSPQSVIEAVAAYDIA